MVFMTGRLCWYHLGATVAQFFLNMHSLASLKTRCPASQPFVHPGMIRLPRTNRLQYMSAQHPSPNQAFKEIAAHSLGFCQCRPVHKVELSNLIRAAPLSGHCILIQLHCQCRHELWNQHCVQVFQVPVEMSIFDLVKLSSCCVTPSSASKADSQLRAFLPYAAVTQALLV